MEKRNNCGCDMSQNMEKRNNCGCDMSQVRNIVKLLFTTLLSNGVFDCGCMSHNRRSCHCIPFETFISLMSKPSLLVFGNFSSFNFNFLFLILFEVNRSSIFFFSTKTPSIFQINFQFKISAFFHWTLAKPPDMLSVVLCNSVTSSFKARQLKCNNLA